MDSNFQGRVDSILVQLSSYLKYYPHVQQASIGNGDRNKVMMIETRQASIGDGNRDQQMPVGDGD